MVLAVHTRTLQAQKAEHHGAARHDAPMGGGHLVGVGRQFVADVVDPIGNRSNNAEIVKGHSLLPLRGKFGTTTANGHDHEPEMATLCQPMLHPGGVTETSVGRIPTSKA